MTTVAVVLGASVPKYPSLKVGMTIAASELTDPMCWAREALWMMAVVNEVEKTMVWVRQFFYALKAAMWGIIGVVPALLGMGLRALVCYFQRVNYIELRGTRPFKQLRGSTVKSYFSNVCCIDAGYTISDGGVLPAPFRTGQIIKDIKNIDPDFVWLMEVGTSSAFEFYAGLKESYAHFFMNIGPRVVGPSSWFFIASKYEIINPRFVPFPKAILDGRSQYAEKGIFSFDLCADGDELVHVIGSHLGHSEIPARPTPDEKQKRAAQMKMVSQEIRQALAEGKRVVLMGDLNMCLEEYQGFDIPLSRGTIVSERESWGGDAKCKSFRNEPDAKKSGPVNLDYVASSCPIQTIQHQTQFKGGEWLSEATSDHDGFESLITL